MPGLPVLAGPGFLRAVVPQYAQEGRGKRGQLSAWASAVGRRFRRCAVPSRLGPRDRVRGHERSKNRLIELTPG
jgi:hypothetical protein